MLPQPSQRVNGPGKDGPEGPITPEPRGACAILRDCTTRRRCRRRDTGRPGCAPTTEGTRRWQNSRHCGSASAWDDAGARNGEAVVIDPSDLCTHGVIVGMTGSGKTGLAVSLIEETLAAGIPVLAIDPKGDLTNLLLTFPTLAPEDFAPWIPEGGDPAEVATTWREGLAGWGLGPDQIAALRAGTAMGVYTPGSTSATPLNIVGTLTSPSAAGADPEAMNDEVQAVTAGCWGLVGIEGDPLASPQHLLVSNLIHAAWVAGEQLDLASLVARIQTPPMRTLGVMELDTVIPPKDRTALAVALNGLLASPGFAPWMIGAPLDVDALLRTPDGRPRLSVIALSHLSDAERQLAVTRVLGAVIRWFRAQPGTDQLRALLYLDEVAGYVPPTANPATKQPILTILKTARAFGLGMVLATQNRSTWTTSRCRTPARGWSAPADRARQGPLLEGMSSAAGSVDVAELDRSITELGKRQFFLHQTKSSAPRRSPAAGPCRTCGPVTGPQLALLPGARRSRWRPGPGGTVAPTAGPDTAAAPETPAASTPPPGVDPPPGTDPAPGTDAPTAPDGTTVTPPAAADGVPVRFVDPAAPWLAQVGGSATSTTHQAGLAIRVQLTFTDAKSDTHHVEEWEAVPHPLSDLTDVAAAVAVDHDDRDLRTEAPAGARYLPCDARIDTKTFFTQLSSQLKDHLVREEALEVPVNKELKLWGRPDETAEAFAARCDEAAQVKADAEADKIRVRLAAKVDRLRGAVETAEQRAASAAEAASDTKGTELTGFGGTLLGGLLGGRSRTRGLATAARKAMSGRERVNKPTNAPRPPPRRSRRRSMT